MNLLAMNSLHEEKGNDRYLWCEACKRNVVCYEDNYIPERKFKLFNSLYHSVYRECTLFFQNVCFLLPIVCLALSVENLCNETLRPVTTERVEYYKAKRDRVSLVKAKNYNTILQAPCGSVVK